MIAKYPGRCGICQEPIHEGDEIDRVDDEYVHAACAETFDDDE